MSWCLENNIQGSAHLANVNNVVSQACYEFFHDETKVTRSEAKARCEAKGYILPEILTPQNWADFKAVADSIKKSKHFMLHIKDALGK